jgi:hypothetical protein
VLRREKLELALRQAKKSRLGDAYQRARVEKPLTPQCFVDARALSVASHELKPLLLHDKKPLLDTLA